MRTARIHRQHQAHVPPRHLRLFQGELRDIAQLTHLGLKHLLLSTVTHVEGGKRRHQHNHKQNNQQFNQAESATPYGTRPR